MVITLGAFTVDRSWYHELGICNSSLSISSSSSSFKSSDLRSYANPSSSSSAIKFCITFPSHLHRSRQNWHLLPTNCSIVLRNHLQCVWHLISHQSPNYHGQPHNDRHLVPDLATPAWELLGWRGESPCVCMLPSKPPTFGSDLSETIPQKYYHVIWSTTTKSRQSTVQDQAHNSSSNSSETTSCSLYLGL
jgi:hypothetical protein